eukprot:SAG31_NODE_5635_length_2411_cov_3.088668_2_plen_168_part_00
MCLALVFYTEGDECRCPDLSGRASPESEREREREREPFCRDSAEILCLPWRSSSTALAAAARCVVQDPMGSGPLAMERLLLLLPLLSASPLSMERLLYCYCRYYLQKFLQLPSPTGRWRRRQRLRAVRVRRRRCAPIRRTQRWGTTSSPVLFNTSGLPKSGPECRCP